MARLSRHRGLVLLCILFWCLVRLNSSVISPFEGPDEPEHLAWILNLRQTGHYPTYADFDTTPIRQQVGQPPLYYTVASIYSTPFYDAGGLNAARVKLNPWIGFHAPATSTDNRNYAMMNTHYQALEP
ncbi:MAG TPA: hypothetical protein VHL11_25345, partial [Phototrophicaceae bacterium]|nr:hypothetical protein [Phototrophicaceae bacterium]